MIRQTTGRVISLVLAAVLAMTSYVPSYAQDVTDPIIDEDFEEPEEEIEEESEEEKPEVEEPKEEKPEVEQPEVEESKEEKPEVEQPEVEPEESLQLLTASEEEPVQLLTASEEEPVTIPIKYSDDISFPDPESQPATSIVWTGESSMDITVPFPAIPEGYELQSMWAVFKSNNGFINLPESRNDEDSTYTFTNYYFNMMDLQEGITIGADFTQVYDENDPNAKLEIPIRYSLNYKFPADMPKSVKGQIGQTVYFILPYPEVPEGYELNYLRCMASSYGNNALYGTLTNDDTAYIYEYVVSKEDVASGITVFPEFERVIEAVFEDGAHGHHVLAEGDDGKYHLQEFIWGDAVYPGSSVWSKITYVPDHGYTFAGMYYSEEMDDTCILYMPGQDGGTQISEDMLSDDGKLHIYATWEPLTAEIYLQFGNYGDGGTVTYGEKLPDFSNSSYDSYYVKKDGKKIEIIPGESFFDENIDYLCELDRMTGLPKVFYFYVYAEKSKFSTVSFDTGVEDVAIDSQRILNGQTVAKPQVQLERDGLYLAGWYTDAAFTSPLPSEKRR